MFHVDPLLDCFYSLEEWAFNKPPPLCVLCRSRQVRLACRPPTQTTSVGIQLLTNPWPASGMQEAHQAMCPTAEMQNAPDRGVLHSFFQTQQSAFSKITLVGRFHLDPSPRQQPGKASATPQVRLTSGISNPVIHPARHPLVVNPLRQGRSRSQRTRAKIFSRFGISTHLMKSRPYVLQPHSGARAKTKRPATTRAMATEARGKRQD